MENNLLTDIYGRGWAFPPQFSLSEGIVMAEGPDDVYQSLHILFSTEPGERIMRENFGCGLQQYLFENIDDALLTKIERTIFESISLYERRATTSLILAEKKPRTNNKLQIRVEFHLRGSDIGQIIESELDVNEGLLKVAL